MLLFGFASLFVNSCFLRIKEHKISFEVLAYLLLNQFGNLGLLTNELGFEDVEVPYILTLTKK